VLLQYLDIILFYSSEFLLFVYFLSPSVTDLKQRVFSVSLIVTISLKWPFSLFSSCFLLTFLLFLTLPTTVGDADGLVVEDVDGLVVRSSGCRQIGCRYSSRHTGMEEVLKVLLRDVLLFDGENWQSGSAGSPSFSHLGEGSPTGGGNTG
jgi:hypothetical protein